MIVVQFLIIATAARDFNCFYTFLKKKHRSLYSSDVSRETLRPIRPAGEYG